MIFTLDGDVSQNLNNVETGTYDCNKVRGWFEEELEDKVKLKLEDMLKKKFNANTGLKK